MCPKALHLAREIRGNVDESADSFECRFKPVKIGILIGPPSGRTYDNTIEEQQPMTSALGNAASSRPRNRFSPKHAGAKSRNFRSMCGDLPSVFGMF